MSSVTEYRHGGLARLREQPFQRARERRPLPG